MDFVMSGNRIIRQTERDNALQCIFNMSGTIYHGTIYRPIEIELVNDWLTWKRPPITGPENWVTCTDRTLVQFTRLKTDYEVLHFARRYGVFGAKKVKGIAPPLPNELRLDAKGGRWCVSMGLTIEDREPTWIWHFLSRQARAMLRVNASLKGRSRDPLPAIGAEDDWGAIAGAGEALTDVRDGQFFLMLKVNEWLQIGGVGLRLGVTKWSRTKTDWKIEIGSGSGRSYNLFGQIAYRLFLSVVGEDRLYACNGCGNPYIRLERAPRPGQNNYCSDCAGLAAKRASQRWKAKKQAGLRPDDHAG